VTYHVHVRVRVSAHMLLFLATKLCCVSKNLQSQQKPCYDSAYMLYQQIFYESAINEFTFNY